MKKSRSFLLAYPLGGCALLLAVVLPGCETQPPVHYVGGRTEYISSRNGGSGASNEDETTSSARHRRASATATPRASAPPSAQPPGKVESEVQDPSELNSDDTNSKKKTDTDKKPKPAKVESEIRNPSDLH